MILARMDLKTKGALNYGIDNLQLGGKFDMINVHPLNFNWVSLSNTKYEFKSCK